MLYVPSLGHLRFTTGNVYLLTSFTLWLNRSPTTECRIFLTVSWHPPEEFSWCGLGRTRVNYICKGVAVHGHLSGSWTSAWPRCFGRLPCCVFVVRSLQMFSLGGWNCPFIYDLKARFILSALMKQISISSLDQFHGFAGILTAPSLASFPPWPSYKVFTMFASKPLLFPLFSVTWNAYPHTQIQLLQMHQRSTGLCSLP